MPTNAPPILSRESMQRIALQNRRLQMSNQIAQQRFEHEAGQQELQALSQIASINQQMLRLKDSIQKQKQIKDATAALANLSEDDPHFETKLSQILYKNPAASSDPLIKNAIEYRYRQAIVKTEQKNRQLNEGLEYAKQHGINYIEDTATGLPNFEAMQAKAQQRTQAATLNLPEGFKAQEITIGDDGKVTQRFEPQKSKVEKMTPEEKQQAYRDAIAGGSVKAGTVVDGKFSAQPTVDAAKPATHVEVNYLDPISGKPTVDVLPVEQFNQFKSAKTPTPEATPAQTPSESTPQKQIIRMKLDDSGTLQPIQ